MADTIERLYKLTVDGTAASRQLEQIARSTDALDKRMQVAGDSLRKFAGILTTALSAGAIVAGIGRVIDSFDQLAKDAQKIGVAAEDLQRLRYAADLSGVSADKLDTALTRLAVGMDSIGDKGSKAGEALRRIGV